MPHLEATSTNPARLWLPRLASLLAAAAGAIYSYEFGALIGGPLVGVVLALNGAVCGSVLAGALVERLCRVWPRQAASFGAGGGSG
jgi:hypothetical protein